MSAPLSQHDQEIWDNLQHWKRKPLLRRVYRDFHREIASWTRSDLAGLSVELGSGIGNIQEVLPQCLRTDLFANPWIDQLENAYRLTFGPSELANLILFDVFHHLRHPGDALAEFARVLEPGGRLILFEPCLSLLGLVVYGWMHHEPLGLNQPIEWRSPPDWSDLNDGYYAAQGNASRIFLSSQPLHRLDGFHLISVKRLACLSYVASGGYRGPQLYPEAAYPWMRRLDRLCDRFPLLFATRLLVCLERE